MNTMKEQVMSGKEKRMMEAARLRYMEDLTNQEIADRLGLQETTVRSYFSEDDMDQFKRFYSDQELFKLQQTLESEVRDGYQLANNLLAKAIQDKDASPNTKLQAAKQAQKIRERQVKLLQELGILQKPKERKEVQETSKDMTDVQKRLQQAYQEKMEAQKDE